MPYTTCDLQFAPKGTQAALPEGKLQSDSLASTLPQTHARAEADDQFHIKAHVTSSTRDSSGQAVVADLASPGLLPLLETGSRVGVLFRTDASATAGTQKHSEVVVTPGVTSTSGSDSGSEQALAVDQESPASLALLDSDCGLNMLSTAGAPAPDGAKGHTELVVTPSMDKTAAYAADAVLRCPEVLVSPSTGGEAVCVTADAQSHADWGVHRSTDTALQQASEPSLGLDSLSLQWLRRVTPEVASEYLMGVAGMLSAACCGPLHTQYC